MDNSQSNLYQADQAVGILKNNYFKRYGLLAFLRFIIGWCFAFGIVVLFFRIFNFKDNYIHWFWAGLPLAFIFGYDFASKHKVPDIKCIAAIDAFNKAGGLLLSEKEIGDKSWKTKRKNYFLVPEVDFSFDINQLLSILFIAFLFAVSSYFVPLPTVRSYRSSKIDLEEKVNEIKEQIEVLEEENVITSEEKQKLEESLEEIVDSSNNESPGVTIEALDHLKEKLQNEANSEVKKRITDVELLKKLEDYIKESRKAAEEAKMMREALENFKNQLRKAGMSEAEINDYLNKQFGSEVGAQGPTKEQMKSFSQNVGENLQERVENSRNLIEKFQEKNLLNDDIAEKARQSFSDKYNKSSNSSDKNSFFNLENATNNNSKETEESQKTGSGSKENDNKSGQTGKEGQLGQEGQSGQSEQSGQEGQSGQSEQSGQEGQSGQSEQSGQEGQSGQSEQSGQEGQSGQSGQSGQEGQSGQSGQSGQEGQSGQNGQDGLGLDFGGAGGIGKGGGYTPMSYGDKASDHNVKYRDEQLPEVKESSANDSVEIGVGFAAPKVNTDTSDYNAKDFKGRDKVGNNISDKNLLPKYRNTVKNYFNR